VPPKQMPISTTDADARECERITRRHARTFTLASRFLSPAKRRAAFAVYAFCRTVDDIVDESRGRDSAEAAIVHYRRALADALVGMPDGPVLRELARAVTAFGLPASVLHRLINGVARDLDGGAHPASWPALAEYCEGVASTVGELCALVFGVEGDALTAARAIRYARTLGVAMQLTNILRDVGEDARRGRCYLPADELTAFGLDRADILACDGRIARDERWRPLMAFQIGRARSLYEAAAPGLSLLAPDARRCAIACATGYAAILDAIEQAGYDTITQRVSVPLHRRAALIVRVWRDAGTARVPAPGGDGPFVRWDSSPRFPWSATWA